MRQKDAEQIAAILGRELETCMALEVPGLMAGLQSLEAHMIYKYPDFDKAAYRQSAEEAAGGSKVFWDSLEGESHAGQPI